MKRLRIWDCIIAAAIMVVGLGMLMKSSEVMQGVRGGLEICAGTLIPALFPFMALASFLSLTRASEILSKPLTPLTVSVLKLPKELGAVVLLSLVGGYPVGAKSISLLLSQKKIAKMTAERMLCFCVNSGPSFLITAVGVGMLASKTAGIILFLSQTLATILIGMAVSLRAKPPKAERAKLELGAAEAFVAAVNSASTAMIAMCAFAVLFSSLLALVFSSGFAGAVAGILRCDENIVRAMISGLFEVTSGCKAASKIGGALGFGLVSAIVSFCSLSILFQIMSCFREEKISFRPLILARIAHIPLAAAISVPLYMVFCKTQTVFAPVTRPAAIDMRTMLISACLLCMCVFLSVSGSRNH